MISPQIVGGSGGNLLQNRRYSVPFMACCERRLSFACVWLRRKMIDEVGLLDERFTGYGCEDDDYCRRAREAGWKLGVTGSVAVEHGFGGTNATSSFRRGLGNVKESAERMRDVYRQKWGTLP